MTLTVTSPATKAPPAPGYLPVKRFFDIVIAAVILFFTWPILLLIALAVRATSPGPALYWSRRAGREGEPFDMPKFRSMRTDAPKCASRDLDNPDLWLTPLGGVLRRTSLDELPQLWSVLTGQMSFIGPRAVMVEETDLLTARARYGVEVLRPGISGWAQVNGRDYISVEEKAALDAEYLRHCSVSFDLMIALKTINRVLGGAHVSH